MTGDATTRFCGACKLNVYNLENLDFEDVRQLWLKNEGKVCVRLFRRFDGTVLTRDCPRGWRRVKKLYRDESARAQGLHWPSVITLALTFVLFAMGMVVLFGDNIRRLVNRDHVGGALAGSPNIEKVLQTREDAERAKAEFERRARTGEY